MSKNDRESLIEHEKAMKLALRMQECIGEDEDALHVGLAAQKIATICAVEMEMPLESFLEASAYCFMATLSAHKRVKK